MYKNLKHISNTQAMDERLWAGLSHSIFWDYLQYRTKINEEKIGGPYVIRAIGNSDYLKTALEIPGGILRILESAGIGVNLKKENNVFVPKYNRVYKTEYIKNKEI